MKEDVNKSQFMDRFKEMGRDNQFTYDGKSALFDYLEQYEEDTGEEIEMDVIALCCEYAEYESLEEFQKDYNKEEYPNIESIENNTTVIKIENNGFIIQQF